MPDHTDGTLNAYRLACGEVCPGWQRPRHDATNLCVDSEGIGVLCEDCTRAKRGRT